MTNSTLIANLLNTNNDHFCPDAELYPADAPAANPIPQWIDELWCEREQSRRMWASNMWSGEARQYMYDRYNALERMEF